MQTSVNRRGKNNPGGKPIIAAIIGGILIAGVITTAGLMIGAWLLDQSIIGSGQNQYIGIILTISAAAMLVGGCYAAGISQEKPMAAALGVGILYVLLRVVLAVGIGDGWNPDAAWWGQSIFQIGMALVGGFIGKLRK